MAANKQAVIVIHGIGEQRPMQTIRSFVETVWQKDSNLEEPKFWNKPSSVSNSFEQRRLTTNSPNIHSTQKPTARTDFYEYYWAHHTAGSSWKHFTDWAVTMFCCLPGKYKNHPKSIKRVWLCSWLLLLLMVISSITFYFFFNQLKKNGGEFIIWAIGVFEASLLVFIAVVRSYLAKYLGDIGRYIRAEPENIRVRQAIREDGINFLERIQQTGDYDRIILVGHSLGSIIAYDILNHLWARHNKFKDQQSKPTPLSEPSLEIIQKMQTLAQACGTSDFKQGDYRARQYDLFKSLRQDAPAFNWLISDFVTIGSPLTYADFLLYDNETQFTQRKLDRECPLSPPVCENKNFYYGKTPDNFFLHHAAVFAPVRWTNIYMKHRLFYQGDIISGPVSRFFSYKLTDVADKLAAPDCIKKTPIQEIELDWKAIKKGFCHNLYWTETSKSEQPSAHIKQLRTALSLY